MVATASIVGVVKTLLMIAGGFVLLRFIGQFMIAKRDMEEERELNKRQRLADKERSEKFKNFGKTTILGGGKRKRSDLRSDDVQDVDYEELK